MSSPAAESRVVRIGNAQGFWGDDGDAAARLVAQQPDLDYLTLDYLAEVSMSILALQRQRDPAAGFARDFVQVVESLVPAWKAGRKFRVVTNAGGLNPLGCGEACAEAIKKHGLKKRVVMVTGDDVMRELRRDPGAPAFRHLETGRSVESVLDKLVTANAYLGADPLIEALKQDADMVITCRVADPSLTVAPAAFEFSWRDEDYDKLAGATIAGHLIECGTQVTGGISTDWLDVPDPAHIGFPVVEVTTDGSCIVTKPANTGGVVNEQTVKEQLLYEIGDPGNYLSPDCTVSFLSLKLADLKKNRVRVSNATGQPAPPTYKVSATYRAGFRAAGSLTVIGANARKKAERCGEIIRTKLREVGCVPQRYLAEAVGGGNEVCLRIAVADERKVVVERFSRELMPLVTAGPQGITGYAEGRPKVREIFGYWPCMIDRKLVQPRVEVIAP